MRETRVRVNHVIACVLCALLACAGAGCGGSADEAAQDAPPTASETTAGETARQGRPPPPAKKRGATPGEGGEGDRGRSPGDDSAHGRADTDRPQKDDSGEQAAAEISTVVTTMYRDFAAGDAAGVCSAMSVAAQRGIAAGTPGQPGGSPQTCESALTAFFTAAARTGALNRNLAATVTDVRVDGAKALVTVSFDGRSGRVRLLEEDGKWRFGTAPVGAGSSR